MAIRRIIAAIDVVINGQRQIDNLARGYANLDRMVTSSIGAFRTWQLNVAAVVGVSDRLTYALTRSRNAQAQMATVTLNAANQFNRLLSVTRPLGQQFGNMVGSIERSRTAYEAHNRTTRGLRDNILSLTRSMLLFSVLLPIVRLPQTAIESFGNFIQVSNEFMHSMRAANSLLGLSEENFSNFTQRVMEMRAQTGLLNKDMGVLVEAASSVNAIAIDQTAFKAMGQQAYEADVAFKLAKGSAELARATFSDASESQKTLIQVMSTYQMSMSQMADVQNNLFALQDVGNVRFSELQSTLPRVSAAMAPYIQAATTAAEKQNVMNESMATFAALTHSMTPEMAATSFANIYKDIGQMSAQQQNLIRSWETIRKRQGLGANMSLDPALLQSNGPLAAIQQLRNLLDLQGPLVDAYVANQRKLGNAAPENGLRIAGQELIAKNYFGDTRAIRGFVSQSSEQIQQSYDAYMQSRTGALQRGLGQAELDPQSVRQQAQASMENLQAALGRSVEGPQIGVFNWFSKMVENTMKQTNFTSGDIFQQIKIIASNFMNAFANWFTQGGRAQTTNIGYRLGTFISEAVRAFFSGGKDNVLIEAAGAFAKGFAEGVRDQLPALLGDVLRSSITRAVAEALALRYITQGRMPENVSRLVSVGGAATLQGVGGIEGFGPVPGALAAIAGATVVGTAATAAMRRGWRAPWQQPINTAAGPLNNASDVFTYLRMSTLGRAASPAGNPPMPPTGGRVMPRLNALMRGGSRIGGNLLLNAIYQVPALLGTLMDPNASEREKWAQGGSTIGSVGGGALGALAGGGILSLLTGAAGMIAGGGAGSWAGGMAYDLLHPGAAGGSGQGGLADAGAPERAALAETFAAGIDMSSLPMLLMRSGIAPGISATGQRSLANSHFASATGTGGNLAALTIDQQSMSKELGNEEALNICGPMAAAYFARANGRNPNLKEAVELAKTNFGGTFTGVGASGMSITGVTNLANNLAGGNVAEAFTGQPNWGRIQGDVASGKPAIVNVGPAGKFGGHFFQVAGYNAQTGEYDMGGSGDVIGHQRYWTQAQLQALGGGVIGGVYYNGKPMVPNTGAGGADAATTEAYIRKSAAAHNIDPSAAIRAWTGEGKVLGAGQSNVVTNGVREPSYGPFQLNDNGWGAGAGFDTHNPANWMKNIDYAMTRVAAGGWDPGGAGLHGATAAGLGNWEGITRGGTGKGGVTEADIAAITNGSAAVAGPSGANPVQISINNLMNVEKMDGSTDVRALLGQMADILNQLSSGGSVVGQTGQVAPT